MKRFMRGGGRSGVSTSQPSPRLEEVTASEACTTPSAHAVATQDEKQAAAKLAAAKLAAAKVAAGKVAAAKVAAAKVAAAKVAAAKQVAMKQTAARQEASARVEVERQEAARQEAAGKEAERQQAARTDVHAEAAVEVEEQFVDPLNEGKTELIPNVFW